MWARPGWGADGGAGARLMSSLLQGEPGVPGQAGAPGKEGLIGPKVQSLSTVDIRGVRMSKRGHGRVVGVSGEESCGGSGPWGLE